MKWITTAKRRAGLSLLLVLGILLTLFIAYGLAPFGDGSLVVDDADIQYLDFFLYYKDVLEGRNSISYTFSKLLGGTSIALFSYYLASPLNLLVLFFEREQMTSFYDILVLLKILLATAAFSFFLQRRFQDSYSMGTPLSRLAYVLLPVLRTVPVCSLSEQKYHVVGWGLHASTDSAGDVLCCSGRPDLETECPGDAVCAVQLVYGRDELPVFCGLVFGGKRTERGRGAGSF